MNYIKENNKFKLTFDAAFGNGDTNNGVELLPPKGGITKFHANFLPRNDLRPFLLDAKKDGSWNGIAVIFMNDSTIEIPDFTLTVDFANKFIYCYHPFSEEKIKYEGFCLEGNFDKNNCQSITGITNFGDFNGTNTLKHLDNTKARLTCSIGEKGAVGYFMSAGNNVSYTGGFVVRPDK